MFARKKNAELDPSLFGAAVVGDVLTREYVLSEVKGLKRAGRGLAYLARTEMGAEAIGYVLQAIQHYDGPCKGLRAAELVQELRSMLDLVDEAGREKIWREELTGIIITAGDLVENKPRVEESVLRRVKDNFEIVSYRLLTKLGHKGLKAPNPRGIILHFEVCDAPSDASISAKEYEEDLRSVAVDSRSTTDEVVRERSMFSKFLRWFSFPCACFYKEDLEIDYEFKHTAFIP